MSALPPILIGVAFGFALQKGRLGRYETIVGVFRFVDWTVLKFLLSALMVAMLGIQSLVALGLADAVPVVQTYALGNALGGVLFGAAMALTGFCPGTVAAGAGEGRLDYLIPGALGLYAGAVAFGWSYPYVYPALARVGRLGAVTGAQALAVDPWLLVVVFWELGLLLFYVLERATPAQAGERAAPALR